MKNTNEKETKKTQKVTATSIYKENRNLTFTLTYLNNYKNTLLLT